VYKINANIIALSLLVTVVLIVAFPIIPETEASASSSVKSMQFYFHYTDEPVSVAGVQTHYVMNTTRWFKFPTQETAYVNSFYKPVGLPKIAVDFYLYPNLAGPVTVDGTWQVFVWINSSAYKPCGFNVEFKEISIGGETLWTSGAVSPIVTSSIASYVDVPILAYNLSCPSLVHTFSPDTTILAEITMNPGASADCRIWYDSSAYPSKVILPCKDYASLSSPKTFNANSTETNMFSVFWSEDQRKVLVRTNVTDPFGGYDINMVNVTISDPAGRPVLLNVKMSRILDSPWILGYTHVYGATWSYPDTTMSGNYTVTASVVDNNGYYRYLDYGIFEPHIEFNSNVFSIGNQYSVQFRTVDTRNEPLVNAQVFAVSRGVVLAGGSTNSSGWWETNLWAGYYNLTVEWRGTEVTKQLTEVRDSSTFTISCNVYYPALKVVDDVNNHIHGAKVYITSPNGTTSIKPFYANETGFINLQQEPAGTYSFTVWWKGAIVQDTQLIMDSDGPYTIKCQVYLLTIKVLSNNGGSIQDAHVTIFSQDGMPLDFKITNASGVAVSRLPIGTYRIDVFYTTEYWLTHVAISTTKPSVSIPSFSEEIITLTEYPPQIWQTLGFWLLSISVVAVVLALILFLRKKGVIFARARYLS
jgi:hypothetical protein